MLEVIEIEPANKATASVIWLHGLGADGHDFEQIVPMLELPETIPARFVLPHAPEREVTINNGERMRAWYDFIPHSETEGKNDIETSRQQICELIAVEQDRGIDPGRIMLAGFSQGGVIALHTAMRHDVRLAGVIALSTYLYDAAATEQEMNDANLALPILIAHGKFDPMIPIMRAATSRENLIRMGYDVRWFDYDMEHQVCVPEIEEISRFIQEIL